MRVFVSADPSADAAAAIVRRLRAAIRQRGVATIAVSGGSTAPALLEAIGGALEAQPALASATTVWQVDERVAPAGDSARNALQLAGLQCAVWLMPVDAIDLRAAARRYAASLPVIFDVVHLGVGDDGHTASWPPDQPHIAGSARRVEITAPFNGLQRMTLTASVVNGARARVILARGESKRPVLERWLGGASDLQVGNVRRTGTAMFLDELAAPGSSLP
ncbi:MAG TPA: 6-phosphogluconolactonase [Ilumatobacter sp.]|nr:6-phosphogluconolactonase [Ilumatobacter sp.]